jgi:hypothetical protein
MVTSCSPSIHYIQPDDMRAKAIKVDAEFQSLIPAISEEERKQLEQNIVEYGGARDPLAVWLRDDDDQVLLDGHNRLEICTRLQLPFSYYEVELDSRDDAADWIDRNQLGRRNLDPNAMSLLRGRRYNRTKKQGERTDITSGQNVQKLTTAETLAAEHGVDEKTIRRDGKFAEAVETLGIEREVITGAIDAPKHVIVEAVASLPDSPTVEHVARARETVRSRAKLRRKGRRADKAKADKSHSKKPHSNGSQGDTKRQSIDDEIRRAAHRAWSNLRGKFAPGDEHKKLRAVLLEIIRKEQEQFDDIRPRSKRSKKTAACAAAK